jgi:hypothetical protein
MSGSSGCRSFSPRPPQSARRNRRRCLQSRCRPGSGRRRSTARCNRCSVVTPRRGTSAISRRDVVQSARRATSGSTCTARRAGNHAAMVATIANKAAAATNVIPSSGVSPNSHPVNRRVETLAPSRPASNPRRSTTSSDRARATARPGGSRRVPFVRRSRAYAL